MMHGARSSMGSGTHVEFSNIKKFNQNVKEIQNNNNNNNDKFFINENFNTLTFYKT
jgi:hypothetical protein